MRKITIFAIIALIISLSLTACDDGSKNPGGNGGNTSDFTYTEANGKITITKYNGSRESVTIPSKIGGKPVTSIGNSAFAGCTSLVSVMFKGTIPSSGSDSDAFSDLGDLWDKFYATDPANGTPGTYTTTAPVNQYSVWNKK
jgi:hypothetical protein